MSQNGNQSLTARQVAGPVCDSATVEADVPDTIVQIDSHSVSGGTEELVSTVTISVPGTVPGAVAGTIEVSGDGLSDTTGFSVGPGGQSTFEFTFTGVDPGDYQLCAEVTEADIPILA